MNKSRPAKASIRFLRFGTILIAPFFLWNPDYSVIDFLPDFIAYACILLALRRLRGISDVIEDAAKGFTMVLWSTLARIPAVYISYAFINEQERPTFMLLLAFCFAVYEFIFGLPAWNRLFEGLGNLAQTGRGTYPMSRKMHGLRGFTVTFLIIRYSLAVLPELTLFSSQKYDEASFDWSPYTEFFRLLSMTAVFIVGIVWLIVCTVRLAKLCRDTDFFDSCRERYEQEILSKPGIFVRRRIKTALTAFCITCFLILDFYADDLNLIPDALTFAAAAATFFLMKPFAKKYLLPGTVLSAVGAAMSVWGSVASYRFHQQYTDAIVQRSPDAWDAFWKVAPINMVTSLVFIAAAVLLLLCVRGIVDGHCGYVPETMDEGYRERKLAAIRRSLRGKLCVVLVFAVLSGVSGVMHDYMITFDGQIISDLYIPLDAVLALGTFVSAVSASFAIINEAESRYMLE